MRSEDKAGLYITVIFHLAVIIILLVCQIGAALKKESSFELDFTKQEQVEKEKEVETFKEEVGDRIDQLLASSAGVQVKNIAVDRGTTLKDDRNTDAKELYKEADRLAEELDKGFKVEESDDDYAALSKTPTPEPDSKKQAYSGPSVVSWELDGRRASRLSIPAYRCMGAGHVTVFITVDPQGNVINAKIQDDASSSDQCLRNFAVRAARLSKFSASTTAPSRQMGNIVYMFIAQ